MWLTAAVFSAVFAALTAILAKCGIRKTDSDVATAIRTAVVLVFSWIMVFISGSAGSISQISAKSLIFLTLSGIATGASWICYFKALSLGDVNKVVPIDKSSTVLTVLLAIICFGETEHLAVKLIGTALLGVGTLLMVEKKQTENSASGKGYLLYAVGSAVFAAATSILAKVGISGVESNLATAIRTAVVLVMAWLIVIIKGKLPQLKTLDKKELGFIALSGLATGGSWLCYFKALKTGDVNRVAPIDKSSTVLAMLMSFIFLGEQLTAYKIIAMVLIGIGRLMMSIHTGKRGSKAGRWMIFAWMSAIFAALTSILAKIGVQNVNSNLGTAIRTAVVLVMAWIVVAAKGKKNVFSGLGGKAFVFIALSAVSTAASWLCYYYALKIGDASVVVPIDKLSILAVVLFSRIFLKEKLTAMSSAGLVLIVAGTVFTIL